MARQQPAPFLREAKPPKKIVRYRAIFEAGHGGLESLKSDLHTTPKKARDEVIELLIASGALIVEEVPVKRKQYTKYVEVEEH